MTNRLNNIQDFIDHGITLLQSRKFDKAEAIFLAAQAKWPESPLPFIGSARTAYFSNNNNLSLERWIMARERFPDDIQILKGLGNIYLDLNELEKANKCFIEAQEKDMISYKELDELIQEANILIDSKNYTKAEELLLEAESRWPEHIAPFHAHHRLFEIKRRNSE